MNNETQDQQSKAVATGNAYDLIKKRLTEQGNRLSQQTQALNDARLSEFGNTQLQLLARTPIRTEHNALARDLVQVGNYLLFGYNTQTGIKQDTTLDDVFALYRLIDPNQVSLISADHTDTADTGNIGNTGNTDDNTNPSPAEYHLQAVDLATSFLSQGSFKQDFDELYRYYKQTKLLQLTLKDSKLLLAFQIGERISDIRVFRFGISFDANAPDGLAIQYIDNRGERDIALPPAYDFDWTAVTREQLVNGKYPHSNILDTIFVSTVGGSLTVKLDNNPNIATGIYQENVQDSTQAVSDASVFYAKVGSLILLKILPYREDNYRYLVYNSLTEQVTRLDAIGQSCVQLPENHGIVFPNGYYLQTGEHKRFDEPSNSQHTDNALSFFKKIASPNGEDVLFVFYDSVAGLYGLFGYNLIKKQLQNPIFCHGFALAPNGVMVLFSSDEVTRIHPMQIWQTPFTSEEYASQQGEATGFYGKIGNKALVRGIADLYSVARLIANQSVSQKLYQQLASTASKLFDSYYWLAEPQLAELADTIRQIIDTSGLVIDEFAKVQAIQKQTQTALDTAHSEQTDLLRQVSTTTFVNIGDYVNALSQLRQQQGRLISLEGLRYLDTARLDSLKADLSQAESQLAEQTVAFLSDSQAFASFDTLLTQLDSQRDSATTHAELEPILTTINDTAHGLDVLTEILATLDVADATVRTQIIDQISQVYAKLNQSKAKLNHQRQSFGATEAVAQFSAQFRLFSQSIANALSLANTPEQADEQLARLLVQLEELEGQFVDVEAVQVQFGEELLAKREEVIDSFKGHKQRLLDERNKKAQNLSDSAQRMLASIAKRVMASGTTGFSDEASLNTYFASDALVQKVKGIGKTLRELGFSVKADDIDARLKAIATDSYKALKDKTELFENDGNVIKLGKHRFSVNSQPLDLTLLSRQNDDNQAVLTLHLTGTNFYQAIDNAELNSLSEYWDMSLPSETSEIYRGEYLAYSLLQSAKQGQDGLTTQKLYQAFEMSHNLANPENDSPLLDLVKTYITPSYQFGYEKGIHDHDAVLILLQILPLLQTANLLTFEPTVRALAQIFFEQITLHQQNKTFVVSLSNHNVSNPTTNPSTSPSPSLVQAETAWFTPHQAEIRHWQDRAITAYQLQQALHSDTAKNLLVADIRAVLGEFVQAKMPNLFSQSQIDLASDYLAQVLGLAKIDLTANHTLNQIPKAKSSISRQTSEDSTSSTSSEFDKDSGLFGNGIFWQTTQQANTLYQKLETTVGLERFNYLQSVLSKLSHEPKSAYELATTWLNALLDLLRQSDSQLADGVSADKLSMDNLSHYVAETVAMLMIRSDKQTPNFQRDISPISLEVSVSRLLGEHPKLPNQTLTFSLDSFLSQLYQHEHTAIPKFRQYQRLRHDLLTQARLDLRLDEFVARPLSSFVRNRLINDSYLPIIGDNLAKQIGTLGDSKRTDLMGLLMLISPPGYGKTTLMEYVANRLGLIFMKINCPSLGHEVTSLDPAKAPNATASRELEKLNLALEMGNNVMLYLDDIQHTHAEFLQKFISLTDGTRRIDGVWQGESKTYDMRGKKFCVVMAGNPYTETGEVFKVPDMLANRADIYNLGDMMNGMEQVFALSYLENALTSNAILAPLANRDMADVYQFIDLAQGKITALGELTHPYANSEIQEIVAILQKMLAVQQVILQVNQQYIASASQDDKYRTEPAFKLQGSYRNMNKMTEKLSAVMNDSELQQLIGDHYQGEAQLLTTGAESNLLKLAQIRGVMTEAEQARWSQIVADFLRNKAMGGDSSDTGNRMVAQLVDLVAGVQGMNQQVGQWVQQQQTAPNLDETQQAEHELLLKINEVYAKQQLEQQMLQQAQQQQWVSQNSQHLENSLNVFVEKSFAKIGQLYQHQRKVELQQQQQQQALLKELALTLVTAINALKVVNPTDESVLANGETSDKQAQSNSQTNSQANSQLIEGLKQALEPIVMRLDEKLQIDISTDQTGKLIVNNLQKLNQIFSD
ncbi:MULTISPECIES: DNA repair ATPase [unclassified Moraxella]|uniref:DNA repair ATPase n=1 Tax=unclassified Moraxella TaxID=2685852 RepID=UPI003AF6501A